MTAGRQLESLAVFVVDDDSHEATLLPFRARTARRRAAFTFAEDFDALHRRLPQAAPALLFCDNRFPPSRDYRETVPVIRAIGYRGPIIVFSAALGDPCFDEAARFGVERVIDKADFDGRLLDELAATYAASEMERV